MKFEILTVALGAAAGLTAPPASAQTTSMDGMTMPDRPAARPTNRQAPPDHGMAQPKMAGMDMAGMDMTGMDMTGMDRGQSGTASAGSGTSRLPGDEGAMHGFHLHAGEWALMLHGYAWDTYSNQGGPRGDEQAFVTSMAMVEAGRDVSATTRLQLRGMFSLDPLIGARGYPNLLATGETADGVPLVDRQHPHDLFMELSARIDTDIGDGTTAFLYGGPVGEPALGPSAFMHRRSARFNPEAPITHHWFDSTHITYGVVTAGVSRTRWQLEASAFRGREPDEHRWNIETPALDSWSVRATWTPSRHLTASLSHGLLKAPEAPRTPENEHRTVGTLAYASKNVAVTAAYAVKQHGGRTDDAAIIEADWSLATRHDLFGRVEMAQNRELFELPDPLAGPAYRVGKATLGYAYTLPLGPLGLSLGGSVSAYAKPGALDPAYGRSPHSFTLFAKKALGG